MLEGEIRDRAICDIVDERYRQVRQPPEGEGWTTSHDDRHKCGELAMAAACYALPPHMRHDDPDDPSPPAMWPIEWDEEWWKPRSRRRDLVRAAALLVAEIERLDRALVRQKLREASDGGA